MRKERSAILLLNVGTPDNPSLPAVRGYLSEFLNDPRVMNLPWLARKILVNLIIVPFRAPRSAMLYQRIWTKEGSPLLTHCLRLQEKLQEKLKDSADVFIAMRYQHPSIREAMEKIRKGGYEEVVVLPLFPQYASSTSGTAIQAVLDETGKWNVIPRLQVIPLFYDHPAYIEAFSQHISSYHPETYDYVLFSYHGLPDRHIDSIHPGISSSTCRCEKEMPSYGRFCYKAACYETTRLLVRKLNLTEGHYSTSFQSRLSGNWMKPFSDQILEELAGEGKKRILVAAPSFTADCLETISEIGYEYKNKFIEAGGEDLTLVESLNASDNWAEALKEIITTNKNTPIY